MKLTPSNRLVLKAFSKLFFSSQKIHKNNISPKTIPNIFQNFGKKSFEPEPNTKNAFFFLNKRNSPLVQNLIKDIEETMRKLDNCLFEKSQISTKNHIQNLLDFYLKQINSEDPEKFEKIAKINKIYLENIKKMFFSLSHNETINKIIVSFIDSFLSCEYYEFTKKTIILTNLQAYLEVIIPNLETEVYKTIHNKNRHLFINETVDLTQYKRIIGQKSTISFFIELGFFPQNFNTKFMPFLFKEANLNKDQNLKKTIDEFIDKLGIYFEKTRDPQNFIEKIDSKLSTKKIQNILKEFISLDDFNEFLYFLFNLKEKQISSELLLSSINDELLKNLQKILMKSPIHTVLLFIQLTSSQSSRISRNKLISFQILQHILKKIQNFSQFLAIFSDFLDNSFINIDELLKEFYKYSLDFKYSLNSLEILQFVKLTQKFYLFSHENDNIFSLLKSIDDILRKNLHRLNLSEKFLLICYLESIDIPSKIPLNSEIIKNLSLCPQELLSKIILHICDFSYNLIDFKDLEILVSKNFSFFDKFEKINILKGFIYHLQGSEGFINNFLEDCIKELNFNDPVEFQKNPLSLLCNFYQIIFTIQNFYKQKFSCLESIKSWFIGFQRTYEEYDQPFYPSDFSFSKEEYELELFLRNLNLSFEKEKKILLHRVDFFIENRLCLELLGRHHFASKFLLNGKTKWKERNIREKSGFGYFSISVEKWKITPEIQRIKIIQTILAKK